MVKITNLPPDTAPSTDDILVSVDIGTNTTKKVTLSDLVALIFANIPTTAINLGYAEKTSNFTTTTTGSDVDVTGLSITVNVPTGGRSLELTAFCPQYFKSGSSGDLAYWVIKEGSTTLQAAATNIAGSNYGFIATAIKVFAPTAGLHTYKVCVFQNTAGTIQVSGTSTAPSFIHAKLI